MDAKLLKQCIGKLVRSLRSGADAARVQSRFHTDSEALSTGDREALTSRLKWCEEEMERLRVENEQLRLSSNAFADLAERLNRAVTRAGSSGASGRTPIPG